ncbi:MAG TPA: hypothetical protein VHF23_09215, partial [Gaiellaceae bacterium]|nr:hypothetical protein [Gaiellaceae bacterium]
MDARELIGNAAECGDLAWIRLTVEAGRIVSASGGGPGSDDLCRDIRGLTTLEAAAVRGSRLAGDALAEALGPAVAAQPAERRVAVAMSGGVDSAVALERAREAGCEPVG